MGYAVVDVETTGFAARRSDRVVEVAVVQLDARGEPTGEWCTLLNPGRDLGPQHVHRISAADVWAAPTFAQVAGALTDRLAGRVLVAHNLAFDARFLAAEFARLGVELELDGLCTMRLAPPGAGRSLRDCCAAVGIDLEDAHSALHDARATARLFAHYLRNGVPAAAPVPWPRLPGDAVEVRRGNATPSRKAHHVELRVGDVVVFTGQTADPRDVWISRARAAGLVSHGYVTRATRLVVAADPFTLSTKARRARAYEVPVVSEAEFADALTVLSCARKDHRTGWHKAY
ncbi:exonuclease domain-containing protein [Saccharothrix variisporea]|uniref:DNA polymerase-3 subunit epsilon n=1 Tax=Saccharothrix variisporea TaxID=543527 RepID=A0A495XG35_9PSEU|nr:exonuclease domain-containing protein [Saccharothrix variisporea]RKT71593.1 DNA polymerase-3 subunit epsilon [Saccharothrix variisporea]